MTKTSTATVTYTDGTTTVTEITQDAFDLLTDEFEDGASTMIGGTFTNAAGRKLAGFGAQATKALDAREIVTESAADRDRRAVAGMEAAARVNDKLIAAANRRSYYERTGR